MAFTAIGVGLWRRSPEFGVLILPGLVQELLVAVSFLVRGRARSSIPRWRARNARCSAKLSATSVMSPFVIAGQSAEA